jgi:dihydrofolate reductase
MRPVVLGLSLSLDSRIARPDGSLDFLIHPNDYSMGPFFKTVDTAIMGRKTYEVGMRMTGGKIPDYGMAIYVYSQSLPPGKQGQVTFVNENPKSFVAKLRKSNGKRIWHMGGGELARAFLQDDLIDELYLAIVPTLLGEGVPLFPDGFPQRNFRLVENKTYSEGLIALQYERAPKKKAKH